MPARVKYDEIYRDRSWDWLQDAEIRDLTMTPVFTRDVQKAWFASLPEKTDYIIWGIAECGQPIGAFGLKNVTHQDAEYWGYIGERSHWGKGIGRWMVNQSLAEASRLGLTRIYLKVIIHNERAIRLYRAMGFSEAKREQALVWMERSVQAIGIS